MTLNIGGGIAAGDRIAIDVAAAEGATVAITAQAAERFYRALDGSPPARVRNAVAVALGASVEWLPQETILFDGASLERRLDVELAADARFLGLETLVFGRTAMGETVRRLHLRDLIAIRREGRPILHDAVRLDGDAQAILDRPATGGGARAFGTLILAAPDAPEWLAPVRAALEGVAVEAGASAWDGMLVVRVAARNGAFLRAAIVAGLNVLRGGRPLPRVWMC